MRSSQHPKQLVFAAAAFASLAVSLPASAHICLEAPVSRIGPSCGIGSAQKPGPCGINTRSTKYVAEFKPGETITVTLNETVDHPSHYRIAFNPGGAEFEDPANKDDKDGKKPFVLLDGIMDESAARQSVKVTLPNMTCDNCTLQLIQVMYDKTGNGFGNDDIYYACADIVLKGAPAGDVAPGDAGAGAPPARPAADAGTGQVPLLPPDAPRDASTGGSATPDAGGSASGGGGTDASGTGTGGTGGTDSSSSGDDGDDGGCSLTHDRHSGHVGASLAVLAVLALTARRRRRS